MTANLTARNEDEPTEMERRIADAWGGEQGTDVAVGWTGNGLWADVQAAAAAVEPLLSAYQDVTAEAEQITPEDCSSWEDNYDDRGGMDCIAYGSVERGAGCAPCLVRAALARLQGDTDG